MMNVRRSVFFTTLVITTLFVPVLSIAGGIPLIVAVKSANMEEVKKLVANGENVNGTDSMGETPLSAAIESGQTKIMDYLLDHGADPNASKKLIRNLISKNNINIIERLLNSGAKIDGPPNTVWSDEIPLLEAIQWGKMNIALMLIKRGANVNIEPNRKDKDYYNALSLAAIDKKLTPVLKALLDAGANPNTTAIGKSTPLHRAASEHNIEAIKLLVGKGANVNAVDSDGINILFNALYYKQRDKSKELETIKFLIARGADATHPYQSLKDSGGVYNGNTLLHFAVKNGSPETIQYLINQKLDINAQNDLGETPLHYAADQNKTGNFELLLKNGANQRLKDNVGKDPVYNALLIAERLDSTLLQSYKTLFKKYKIIE